MNTLLHTDGRRAWKLLAAVAEVRVELAPCGMRTASFTDFDPQHCQTKSTHADCLQILYNKSIFRPDGQHDVSSSLQCPEFRWNFHALIFHALTVASSQYRQVWRRSIVDDRSVIDGDRSFHSYGAFSCLGFYEGRWPWPLFCSH